VSLSASAADPERDPLSYQWSVMNEPDGPNAALTSRDASATSATGLTVAGDYVFQVELSDPSHTGEEKLIVTVDPPNPSAPTILSAAAAPTALTLPVATTRLSATTRGPDGHPISHSWSIKSRAAGATPALSAQGSPASDATGLTVPGVYVFTLDVVDRTKTAQRNVTAMVRKAP
jgi:hypothetical protein